MRVLVLMSGGLDSSALAALMLQRRHETLGLFVDYGQPSAQREREAAHGVARQLGIELHESSMPLACDQLLGSDACVVPGRNLALLSAAANARGWLDFRGVGIGVTATDKAYADCAAGFIGAAGTCLQAYGLHIVAPFVFWPRQRVLEYAIGAGLRDMWSCYRNGERPCGECASCNQS
jgi:7-cyano-7-deazaguanine synthase